MSESDKFKINASRWVETALKNENIQKFKVEICGTAEKSDGYLGDIVFVNVPSILKSGQTKTFHLVFKLGKSNEHLRKAMPVTEVYNREIYIYNVVFPYFEKFQKEKINDKIDYIAKCYATFNEYGTEALIFENMKSIGYEVYDKTKTMDLQHIKFVLSRYGKWHALSFAIRDQRKEEFFRLSKKLTGNMMTGFLENESTAKTFQGNVESMKEMLKENNEIELLRKFTNVAKNGLKQTLLDLEKISEERVVISHGDCWNNNFMFKYGKHGKAIPETMVLIDWQLSSLVSPVFDLSYFLYIVTSEKELQHFEELLKTYHTSLSQHIRKLGSDPDKLFSFSNLLEHWRKYSSYMVLLAPTLLQFVLAEADDAPSLGDVSDVQGVSDMVRSIKIKDKDQYYSRIKAVIEHYVKFNKIP